MLTHKSFLPLMTVCILAGCASATRPAQSTAVAGPAPATAPAPMDPALLPLRYDASSGKVFLTIPRLGERLLYLNTLATGVGLTAAWLDRGQLGDNAIVRFERRGARVYLIRENTAVVARSDNAALQRSVDESFPSSVLASFAVQRDAAGGVVVDATDFFLSDMYDVIGALRGAQLGSVRLDRERSFIDPGNTRSFPENTEIRSVLTFSADDPSAALRLVAPDARTMAVEQHHSFIRLPDPPLPLRPFDPRSGLFTNDYFDFAQAFSGDYRQRAALRWRLEPKDTAAYLRGEKVEPVKPIVYYIDAGIPEPYRSAFIEGGRWWNEALGAAGWRNAFRIETLPAGASPLDARYPAIYWVHRMQRGPSVGPAMIDPRTGEIVKTVVRMDSYRSLVNHDIYMGLLPAAPPSGLQLTAEQFSMARRQQHSAHEIGHTLGVAHNYIASTQGRASVMDYPYPMIKLDAQGRIDISDAYRSSGGAHDTLAIRYAYTWFRNAAEEAAGLSRLVREAEARGLRFVADEHAVAAGSIPGASQWEEGDDLLQALQRTMAVRRVLIDRFDERAAQPGEPLAVLNRRFAHVYLHHRYALVGAIKYVGGMEFGYALRGERTEPTRILPAAEQRMALRMVLSALQPRELRIPGRIAALIPPVPVGYDSDLTVIPTPAGTAFDPIAAAHSLAQEIVNGLLHPQRAARLVSFHARDASNPSLDEVIGALVDATWSGSSSSEEQGPELRRVAQRAVVDGLLDLAGSASATAGVRATAEHHLAALLRRTNVANGGSAADQGYRAAIRRDIERYFDGRDDPAKRPRPAPIGLPWP